LIGAGGMGTVYEGQREDLAGMPVAIKVLHPRFEDRTEVLVRFRREAEVVATLDHPNIVRVLDFVAPAEGPAFLVMELLRGQTLASAIALEAPFPEQRVAFIASQVLAALEAAHAANVVHRDLKPENLLLTTISGIADVVKLLDFGIAKLLLAAEDDRLTQTGHVLGTPAYMAPEYARGEAATVAGDIYALGCVMYQALTGAQPFTGTNYNAVLFAIQQRSPTPIREVRPDLSEEIVKVVERAMARGAADRFPSARAMAEALRPWAPESVRASVGTPLCIAPTVEAVVSRAGVSDAETSASGSK
jgi:serine/threonine protein kinase